MAQTVIKAENLSKAYQLGDFGTGTISRDIERFMARIRGKEDPFLKIGETNDRTNKGSSDIVWSLKDINFEIKEGEAVGIIGRNGAGKSTLLKILSRVTTPTAGSIKIKGRIASLLEVGTGFHPELTGRENIYLNGAILGMRKKEISRKFDEIVAFAGVERYIDTPVKRYSSGMYVRLAFAVAAHLESEILVVDEVLAVGDAEFQKKCLGKMGEVSKGEGRTVLFVSHNMDAVQTLCTSGILLSMGLVAEQGNVSDVVKAYLKTTGTKQMKAVAYQIILNDYVVIESLELDKSKIFSNDDLKFSLKIRSTELNQITSLVILIYDEMDQKLGFIDLRSAALAAASDANAKVQINGILKNIPLLPGKYNIGLHIQSNYIYKDFFDLIQFEVLQKPLSGDMLPYDISVRGKMEIDYDFTIA